MKADHPYPQGECCQGPKKIWRFPAAESELAYPLVGTPPSSGNLRQNLATAEDLNTLTPEGSCQLAKLICSGRNASLSRSYYFVEADAGAMTHYISEWRKIKSIGVRVPRRLEGALAEEYRVRFEARWVIENSHEAGCWMTEWGGKALILIEIFNELISGKRGR